MTAGSSPSEIPSEADHVGTLRHQYLYLCNPYGNHPVGDLKVIHRSMEGR